jgi:hypothetical protein
MPKKECFMEFTRKESDMLKVLEETIRRLHKSNDTYIIQKKYDFQQQKGLKSFGHDYILALFQLNQDVTNSRGNEEVTLIRYGKSLSNERIFFHIKL